MTTTTFILILLLTGTGEAGPAITTAEFASQQACEAAATQADSQFTGYYLMGHYARVFHVCVPKSQ